MKANRPVLLLCLGVFGALTAMAIVYYLERMTNLDMAFQTFLILKFESLNIQSGRFGAAATQVWPWAAQALGLPLKGVLMAYSLGHVLWPALLACFCWKIGQWRWSVVIALVATLMTTHTFYWLSEMPQGLVFLCAIFAWMHSKETLYNFKWWQGLLWLASLVTAFYFHPLVMYAHAFLCLFFMLEKGRPRAWAWMHLSALAVFVVLAFLKYKVLKLDWYDAVALKRQEAFGKLWPHWFDLESNHTFVEWSLQDYWLIWAVWMLATGYFFWKRFWLRALLVMVWPLGFVLMVNVPYYEAVGQQFYMENLYLPLSVFVAAALVFGFLNQGRKTQPLAQTGIYTLAVLFSLGIFRIYQAHHSWTERLQWEQGFLKETATRPQRKLLLADSQVPMDKLSMSWGTPYEFLLLSSLAHPDSARCILVTDNPDRFDSLLVRPRLFLGSFKNYPFEALPKAYFNLQDTSQYVRW